MNKFWWWDDDVPMTMTKRKKHATNNNSHKEISSSSLWKSFLSLVAFENSSCEEQTSLSLVWKAPFIINIITVIPSHLGGVVCHQLPQQPRLTPMVLLVNGIVLPWPQQQQQQGDGRQRVRASAITPLMMPLRNDNISHCYPNITRKFINYQNNVRYYNYNNFCTTRRWRKRHFLLLLLVHIINIMISTRRSWHLHKHK